MLDRQDIDALLIGSLYGELSSTDEARLKAHLESHPADRTALHRLVDARDAVRRSRILEVQLEPPQSVSALLLQEAARRAPRAAVAAAGSGEGWFARLRRSFLMHPAMAAAAMFVVVLGVAGTIYLRQGHPYVEPELAAREEQRPMIANRDQAAPAAAGSAASAPEAVAAAVPPADKPTPAPTAPLAEPKQDFARRPEVAREKGADTSDGYRVGLAEDSVRVAKAEEQSRVAVEREQVAAAVKAKQAQLEAAPRAMLKVTTPDRAPKDLDAVADNRGPSAIPQAPGAAPPPRGAVTGFEPAGGAPAGTKAGAPAPAADPSVSESIIASAARDGDAGKLRQAPATGGAGLTTAPSVSFDKGGAGGTVGTTEADASWARGQHARLVSQVRAGQCDVAASTALALSSRAPGYYQQNVETDRSVKACLPLINNAREREAERTARARAATKRATSSDEAAKAAPAKPAAADKAATQQK